MSFREPNNKNDRVVDDRHGGEREGERFDGRMPSRTGNGKRGKKAFEAPLPTSEREPDWGPQKGRVKTQEY